MFSRWQDHSWGGTYAGLSLDINHNFCFSMECLHITVRCVRRQDWVYLSQYIYVRKNSKRENRRRLQKLQYSMRYLSLISESKIACYLGQEYNWLVLLGESGQQQLFWWLMTDWLNIMLRRFMQSLIFFKVYIIPLQLLAVGELLGFWLIQFCFFAPPLSSGF